MPIRYVRGGHARSHASKPNHVPEETYAERFPTVCVEIELDEQLGVHAHFWDTSDVVGNPSRHTVNVVYRATPTEANPTIELDDQHTMHRWLTEAEPDLHEYVRLYIDEHDLLP